VFPTSVGFFGGLGKDRKALATIALIAISSGEVLGGAVFGFFGHLTARRGRDPIVLLGFLVSMAAYFLTFLAIPSGANLGETMEEAFARPSKALVVLIAFLLGFSDACFNTQVTSLLGGVFKEQASSAFAIFKFMQSLSCAIAFFYSPFLSLQWQLLAAVVLDVIGTVAFCKVCTPLPPGWTTLPPLLFHPGGPPFLHSSSTHPPLILHSSSTPLPLLLNSSSTPLLLLFSGFQKIGTAGTRNWFLAESLCTTLNKTDKRKQKSGQKQKIFDRNRKP